MAPGNGAIGTCLDSFKRGTRPSPMLIDLQPTSTREPAQHKPAAVREEAHE